MSQSSSFVMHSLVVIYVCCSVMEAYECGNEPSGSIKCREFLDWLQNQLASQEGLCSMEYLSK